MSISYEADGVVVLRSDHEPPRIQTIVSGTPRSEQEAVIVAFFAADVETAPMLDPLESAQPD